MRLENRKARHHYEILEQLAAGIQLSGAEVKSLRAGKASLQEAYCFFRKAELFVKNMYIAPYTNRGFVEIPPLRARKLLLQRKELNKWQTRTEEKGLTIIPLQLFFSKKGLAKLQIGLCRGKKLYDKRQSLREREDTRTLQRLQKQYRIPK